MTQILKLTLLTGEFAMMANAHLENSVTCELHFKGLINGYLIIFIW